MFNSVKSFGLSRLEALREGEGDHRARAPEPLEPLAIEATDAYQGDARLLVLFRGANEDIL